MADINRKWYRPALAIFCSDAPVYHGNGTWDFSDSDDYIYLTDDGRGELAVSTTRIENKQRMINGHMRSYFVADKFAFSTSWTNVPSRATDEDGGWVISEKKNNADTHWAAGQEIVTWYKDHPDSFWALFIYDLDGDFDAQHSYDLKQVLFSDLTYSIVKRGSKFDLWNMSLSLEEV